MSTCVSSFFFLFDRFSSRFLLLPFLLFFFFLLPSRPHELQPLWTTAIISGWTRWIIPIPHGICPQTISKPVAADVASLTNTLAVAASVNTSNTNGVWKAGKEKTNIKCSVRNKGSLRKRNTKRVDGFNVPLFFGRLQ